MTDLSTGTGAPQDPVEWTAVHPVIMEHPPYLAELSGPEKVQGVSISTREALKCSAERSNIVLGTLDKDENGAPRPKDGVFWSVSRTEDYVAAVVAPYAIGIDIEQIKDVSTLLKEQVASELEWQIALEYDLTMFFRYWTAKEAVLKAVGQGLSGLAGCTVTEIVDNGLIRLRYHDDNWLVQQLKMPANKLRGHMGYMAALTKGYHDIVWHLVRMTASK